MRSNKELFYVPATIKIGLGKRDRTHAAITFKNTNHAWLQPAYFERVCGFPCIDRPRNSEIVIKRDMANCVQVKTNEALTGFKVHSFGNGCDYDTTVWFQDPRGWKFASNLQRFKTMLQHHISLASDGTLGGSWVYACNLDTKEIMILNTEWDEYIDAAKEQHLIDCVTSIKSKMVKKNLKVGTVYRVYENRDMSNNKFKRAVYLGEFKYCCDMKKFSKMISNARSSGYYVQQSHKIAQETREFLLKTLEKPKMVFMFLNDQIEQRNIKFNGTYFEPSGLYEYSQPEYRPIYMDEVLHHNEFSIKLNPVDYEGSCLYIVSALDSMIVRGEDTNQTIGCTDNWMKTVSTQYRSYRNSRYCAISNYLIENHISRSVIGDEWHYSTYTVDELKTWVKYLITNCILKNLNNLKFGESKR